MPDGDPPSENSQPTRTATIFLIAFLVIDVVGTAISWKSGHQGNVEMFVMMGLASLGVLWWIHRGEKRGQRG